MAFGLLAAVGIYSLVAPDAAATFRDRTALLIANADRGADGLPHDLFTAMLGDVALQTLAPLLTVVFVVGLLGGISQVGVYFAPKALRFDPKRLSPKQGAEKFKPTKASWELFRATFKLGLLAAVLIGPLTAWPQQIASSPGLSSGLEMLGSEGVTLFTRAAAVAAVIAVLDYAWNRYQFEKKLRMSRSEVKRESKDDEGDPLQKRQRRERAQQLSRNRMIADVTTADAVVTNPTHLAVALTYDSGEPAPRVIAKGSGDVASEIIRTARRHAIPVTQDKPLARTLFRVCNIGDFVPATVYDAVAAVLAVAYRRRGKVPA